MTRLAVLLLCMASVAYAAPPPGTDLNSPEHAWWECQYQNGGASCCGAADGVALDDDQWRAVGSGYQVFLRGAWWDVPDEAIVKTQCGPEPSVKNRAKAKVWFQGMLDGVRIFCFETGTLF